MFLEVASLLNYRVERTVILNEITQDNNKVLEEENEKTVKFHRLDRSMEEAVYKFQSVVEAEQRNGGPQKKNPGRKINPRNKVKQGAGRGPIHQDTERS